MNPKIAHRSEQNGSFLKSLNSYEFRSCLEFRISCFGFPVYPSWEMSQGPFEQQITGVGQTPDQGFRKDLVKTKLGVDGRLVYD